MNNIILENSFEVHKKVVKYSRETRLIGKKVIEILEDKSLSNEDKADKMMSELFKHGEENPWINAEANMIMVYLPNLEDEWRQLSAIGTSVDITFTNEIYKELKNNDSLELEVYIDSYKALVDKFVLQSLELIEKIRNEIILIIKNSTVD